MREIKFKAWDLQKSKMHLNAEMANFFQQLDPEDPEEFDFGDFISNTERFILLQYTGLKDKNGKEVFEGDIVKYWGGTNPVVYHENGFYIKFGPKDYSSMQYEGGKNIEVIGNIYENPELLKTPDTP